MRLVLGLGNPGARYAHSRHNVAWRVLDTLAERHRATSGEECREYRTRRTRFDGDDVELLAPQTFMNASGDAVMEWRSRHGLDPAELLVVTDDVYLPLGALRLRPAGPSGGHRGLESLEAALGSREFARLRVGVGAAEDSSALREHVLEEFAREELPVLE